MGCYVFGDDMRFQQLARIFQEWGWDIKHEHYVAFSDYLKEMLKRKRVMVMMDGENIIAILTYYLTDDFNKIYKKRCWDVVDDNEEGKQIYIDKMIAKKINRETIRTIQNFIEENFPNVDVGIYHREPYDKCVRIYRREIHELQH